jgi:hypothetical protein
VKLRFKAAGNGNYVRNCKGTLIQYHHLRKITLMDSYFINDNKVENPSLDYAPSVYFTACRRKQYLYFTGNKQQWKNGVYISKMILNFA